MVKEFQIVQLTLDHNTLERADARIRNQIAGCMHAHNEITVLNRLLMFSMNFKDEGELHDSARSIQMWCLLQILAGKLVETWKMIEERFLRCSPKDHIIEQLGDEHAGSLNWLEHFFAPDGFKATSLAIIRDKTAFHYDKLSLTDAASNLGANESTVYLGEHPVNSVYYVGSALVFRSAFALIARAAQPNTALSQAELVKDGFRIVTDEVQQVNWHLHLLLYGLIKGSSEKLLGSKLSELDELRLYVDGIDPDSVTLPVFLDMGSGQ